MKRRVYLEMKTLEEAKKIFLGRFGPRARTGVEEVLAEDSLGRVTAGPIFAKISSPTYHSAAMDGIAVRAEQTFGAAEKQPRVLIIGREAAWINTGQALPEGFNSVIMVEKVHPLDQEHLEIRSAAYPWQNVRKVGEDIVATQLLLPQDHKIRPYDIGALVSSGIFKLPVWKKPKVAIIPTGSELVSYKEVRDPGRLEKNQIMEYNSLMLAALVRECAAIPVIDRIVQDREEDIRGALMRALEADADLIIINAGSSAGSKDYTASVIEEMGEVLVHGVAMMPGKPTILGVVREKPVIGNPGYPVSSTLSFQQFAGPLLQALQGQRRAKPKTILVSPSRDIPSKLGIEEFLRVNIGRVGEKTIATPLPRAAGSITTLTRAEGIIRIPALSEGVSQNEMIEAELLVDEETILNTVVVIGSHDMTLDLLGDEIRRGGYDVRISSGNVGSLGGLMALRKGICHMAGSHLLDAETGQYNLSYIRQYLKGFDVTVYHLVLRDQGLILRKGNPKSIRGIEDLARRDVTFVNRQAGSGTRILLDYKLGQIGMSPEAIQGYSHEEFTHMAVAVDVLSGAADFGLGIYAAAKALDLDFIPIEREQYDLIFPSAMIETPAIQMVLDTLRSEGFKERVNSLGGYDPSKSGEIWTRVG